MPGYGTPLSLTLPTIGGLESAAAPLINTALAAMITRLESKVGAADLDINADVSFKSGAVYSGATNVARLALQNKTASLTPATNPATVYVLNGDLHYIDGSGNLVQITAGGQVNVSTTGGITGAGYGATGVEVNWDSVNSRYRLRSGTATDAYADAVLSDVLFNDGSGNFVRLQAPSISADYTITLPTALPASTSLMQMSSGGVLSLTASPSVTAITAGSAAVTGNATVGGDLDVTGTLTPGDIAHGTRNRIVSAWSMSGGSTVDLAADGCRNDDGTIAYITADVPLIAGDRLLSVTVMSERSGGAGDRDLTLSYVDQTTANLVDVQTVTSTAVGTGTVLYNFTDTTIVSTRAYVVRFDGQTGDRVFSFLFTYDRP